MTKDGVSHNQIILGTGIREDPVYTPYETTTAYGDAKYDPIHNHIAIDLSGSYFATDIKICKLSNDYRYVQSSQLIHPYEDSGINGKYRLLSHVCYSSDYTKLYVTCPIEAYNSTYLLQYNIDDNGEYKYKGKLYFTNVYAQSYMNLGPDSCIYVPARKAMLRIKNSNSHIDSLFIDTIPRNNNSFNLPNNIDQLLFRDSLVVSLPDTIYVCEGDSIEISPKSDFASYVWSTDDTTKSITAHESGIYSLIVENEFGCSDTAEAEVIVQPYPNVRITADESVKCTGKPITLTATTDIAAELLWSTGETANSIVVAESGNYWVSATTPLGCDDADTVSVEITGPMEPFILTATRDTLCPNETSTLSPSRDYEFYEWSNGETTREITVNKAGVYTLIVTDENGCETDESYEIIETIIEIETVDELVFERQHIGDKAVKSIAIVNKSPNPVKIESEMLSDNFKLLNEDVFDERIEKLAIMQVQYSSDTPQVDASSIILTVTEPCEWTQKISLRGTSYAETVFMLEDHESSPGETICLPVYAKMKRDYSPSLSGDIEMTFSHYHDLFKATEVRTGSILASNPTPDSRITRFAMPQLTLTPEFAVVGEICGNVYLGSATLTPLELSLADWGNELIYTEYLPGSLFVESCVEHISDIEQFEPLNASITPNPSTNEASVTISGASGKTYLELISPTGEILRSETLNISSDTEKVNIDLSRIASGIYYVQIRSGSELVTKKLSVVR